MKKYLILACWLMTLCYTQAQNNPYLQSSFQIAGKTYLCHQRGQYITELNASQNIFNSSVDNDNIQPICRLANIEREVIYDHVKAVFSEQRRQELLGEKIVIGLYVNRSTGVVKEIYFHIELQSKITPMEVYQLENQLRADTYSQTGLETCPEINVDYVHRRFGFNFE